MNETSRLSDYAIESALKYDEIYFKIDARLDNDNFSKKEMNYELKFNKKFEGSLIYNETQAEALKIYQKILNRLFLI